MWKLSYDHQMTTIWRRLTFRVLDLHLPDGRRGPTLARLVDGDQTKLVLAILYEVRNVEDGGRRRRLVHPGRNKLNKI